MKLRQASTALQWLGIWSLRWRLQLQMQCPNSHSKDLCRYSDIVPCYDWTVYHCSSVMLDRSVDSPNYNIYWVLMITQLLPGC